MDAVDEVLLEIMVKVFCPSVDQIADALLEEAGDLELSDAGALEIAFQIREKAMEHVLRELE